MARSCWHATSWRCWPARRRRHWPRPRRRCSRCDWRRCPIGSAPTFSAARPTGGARAGARRRRPPPAPALQPLRLAAMPDRIGADLLGRRADVVAARWRVEAARAQVDRARADFYPDTDLVGFVGLNALGLDRLLSLGSRQLGVGPALRLPLFDGGALRAQLGVRHAEADAAVAAYNAAVLQAAREAADAAATLRSLALQQAEQARAATAAEAAKGLAQRRHRAGLANRLGVLDADTAVLAQRAAAADLQARALDVQVQLMQALGGGWHDEPPPTARR